MKFMNKIDNVQRFVGLKISLVGTGQEDTDTFSYLYYRNQLKENGKVMGLDKEYTTHK